MIAKVLGLDKSDFVAAVAYNSQNKFLKALLEEKGICINKDNHT